jgi:hypothetical protein
MKPSRADASRPVPVGVALRLRGAAARRRKGGGRAGRGPGRRQGGKGFEPARPKGQTHAENYEAAAGIPGLCACRQAGIAPLLRRGSPRHKARRVLGEATEAQRRGGTGAQDRARAGGPAATPPVGRLARPVPGRG